MKEIISICCQHKDHFDKCPPDCWPAVAYRDKIERLQKKLAVEAEKKMARLAKTIPCARCGKPHYFKRGGQFCSSKCRYEPKPKAPKPIIPCAICEKPISRTATKYCSSACASLGKIKPDRICTVCNNVVPRKRLNKRHCSRKCCFKDKVKTVAKEPPQPKPDKVCACCGQSYPYRISKYCTPKCAKKARNAQHKQSQKRRDKHKSKARAEAFIPQDRHCPHCNKGFTTTLEAETKKFCSRRCSKQFGKSQHRKNNPHAKIKDRLSNRLRDLLSQKGLTKKSPIASYFGKTPKELQVHLEEQFTDGMTWENYGVFGWHVDHYIPCHKFDLTNEEHVKVCFNWRNLRPLWSKENTQRQHCLSVDDRLFMDEELYRMAKAVGAKV